MFYKDLNHFKEFNGYDLNGVWYPRVTSILSIKSKPALYKFYGDHDSFESAERQKNKSAEEGTLIHDIVEAILAGKKIEVPRSVEPAIGEFMKFKNKHEIVPRRIETKIISRNHHYAGTLDVLADFDGRTGILDIKTSQAIYRDYSIQTAAYSEALYEEPDMPPLARWILRIDQAKPCLNGCGAVMREKGGTAKIKNGYRNSGKCEHQWDDLTGYVELKELKEFEKDIRAFLAAKALWEWENDYWLNKIKLI
ncbi:MAG: Uncharacterized protein CEN90_127 [Parcubacteria group bacterium Licking1014_17]|nr:MAG: Uncharacterized protein CEN90_127 [Parcubacteria group bacterium Licking1014_17]